MKYFKNSIDDIENFEQITEHEFLGIFYDFSLESIIGNCSLARLKISIDNNTYIYIAIESRHRQAIYAEVNCEELKDFEKYILEIMCKIHNDNIEYVEGGM